MCDRTIKQKIWKNKGPQQTAHGVTCKCVPWKFLISLFLSLSVSNRESCTDIRQHLQCNIVNENTSSTVWCSFSRTEKLKWQLKVEKHIVDDTTATTARISHRKRQKIKSYLLQSSFRTILFFFPSKDFLVSRPIRTKKFVCETRIHCERMKLCRCCSIKLNMISRIFRWFLRPPFPAQWMNEFKKNRITKTY